MPFYLIQVAYNDTAAKAMIADPQPRENVTRKAAKSLGGKLHAFFFSFGEYDAVAIVELPDNQAAAALALAGDGGGALARYTTTVLLTTAEAVEAMRRAQKEVYAPPT